MTEKDMDEPRTNLRSSGRVPWIVAAAAAALAGAYGAYRLFHRGDEGAAQAAGSAPSPAPAEAAATPPPETDQPVDAAGARTLLESVAKDPLVRSWLAEADPIRRAVVIVANLAENASPRRQLEAFAPSGGFSVAERGQRYVISPASFARYDAFAAAVESVDAQALATAYRRLHGVLEGAARALGYPAGALDHLAARALRRIEAAPLADEEV
ncbi:MAG TPA: DUF3014 domain-containing protein, partial [Anaeromyxobacter sp.]